MTTPAEAVTAAPGAHADVDVDLILGCRRISTPDDLWALVRWDMGEWASAA